MMDQLIPLADFLSVLAGCVAAGFALGFIPMLIGWVISFFVSVVNKI